MRVGGGAHRLCYHRVLLFTANVRKKVDTITQTNTPGTILYWEAEAVGWRLCDLGYIVKSETNLGYLRLCFKQAYHDNNDRNKLLLAATVTFEIREVWDPQLRASFLHGKGCVDGSTLPISVILDCFITLHSMLQSNFVIVLLLNFLKLKINLLLHTVYSDHNFSSPLSFQVLPPSLIPLHPPTSYHFLENKNPKQTRIKKKQRK